MIRNLLGQGVSLAREALSAVGSAYAAGPSTVGSSPASPMGTRTVAWGGEVFHLEDFAGEHLDEHALRTMDIVNRCVDLAANTIALLPREVRTLALEGDRSKSERWRRDRDHWLSRALSNEGDVWTPLNRFSESYLITENYLYGGNAYLEKVRTKKGEVVDLKPIEPSSRVVPDQATRPTDVEFDADRRKKTIGRGELFYWVDFIDGSRRVHRDRIVHLKGPGSDLRGYSPLRRGLGRALGMARAMEEFAAQFFARGPYPLGFVTAPGRLDDHSRTVIREGVNSVGRFELGVLDGNMGLESLRPITLEEISFLQGREFSEGTIADWFNTPLAMIGRMGDVKYNTLVPIKELYVLKCILPIVRNIEETFSRCALGEQVEVRHLMYELLRADPRSQAEVDEIHVRNGIRAPDEIREEMGHDPDGDDSVKARWMSAQYMPASLRYEQLSQANDDGASSASHGAPFLSLLGREVERAAVREGHGLRKALETDPSGAHTYLLSKANVAIWSSVAKGALDAAREGRGGGELSELTVEQAAQDWARGYCASRAACPRSSWHSSPERAARDLDEWATYSAMALSANN